MFDLQDWLKGDKITAPHLQQAVAALRQLGDNLAGDGLAQLQTTAGTTLSLSRGEDYGKPVRVKISGTVAVGVYTAYRLTDGIGSGIGTSNLSATSGDLGTQSDDVEVYVIDPSQADSGLSAKPLDGLITSGYYVGTVDWGDAAGVPIVEIPPTGIQTLRWSGSPNYRIEAAYVLNPEEDQWVPFVSFVSC